jgi:hypothetical protein
MGKAADEFTYQAHLFPHQEKARRRRGGEAHAYRQGEEAAEREKNVEGKVGNYEALAKVPSTQQPLAEDSGTTACQP